jgi:hypothetical protein
MDIIHARGTALLAEYGGGEKKARRMRKAN